MDDILGEIVFWTMIGFGLTLLTSTWADLFFVMLMVSAKAYIK